MESGPSGLDHIVTGETGGAMVTMASEEEVYEPGWSGLGAGLLAGALLAMLVGLFAAFASLFGSPKLVQDTLATDMNRVIMVAGILLVVCVVFGAIGGLIGRASAR
jgi:hypothetical protein